MALNVTDYRFVIVEVANDTEQQSVPFKAGQYILADTGEAWYDPSTGSELGDRVTLNSETAQALQSLTTRVSTAEGSITTLQSNMSTAQGDITALEGRMDTAESDITAVEADVSDIQDSLGAADGIDDYYHPLLQCYLAQISPQSGRNGLMMGYAKEHYYDYPKKYYWNKMSKDVILQDIEKDLANNQYGHDMGRKYPNKSCVEMLEHLRTPRMKKEGIY